MAITTLALFVSNILCVFLARSMAVERSKSPKPWMWAAAFFGPLPLLVLAVLSGKAPHPGL